MTRACSLKRLVYNSGYYILSYAFYKYAYLNGTIDLGLSGNVLSGVGGPSAKFWVKEEPLL